MFFYWLALGFCFVCLEVFLVVFCLVGVFLRQCNSASRFLSGSPWSTLFSPLKLLLKWMELNKQRRGNRGVCQSGKPEGNLGQRGRTTTLSKCREERMLVWWGPVTSPSWSNHCSLRGCIKAGTPSWYSKLLTPAFLYSWLSTSCVCWSFLFSRIVPAVCQFLQTVVAVCKSL